MGDDCDADFSHKPWALIVVFLLLGASTDKPKYRDLDLAFGFRAWTAYDAPGLAP